MNEELQKYWQYLRDNNADVPDTFESFHKTLQDDVSAKKYYDYLKSEGFDAPETFESFSSTLGLKKKRFYWWIYYTVSSLISRAYSWAKRLFKPAYL